MFWGKKDQDESTPVSVSEAARLPALVSAVAERLHDATDARAVAEAVFDGLKSCGVRGAVNYLEGNEFIVQGLALPNPRIERVFAEFERLLGFEIAGSRATIDTIDVFHEVVTTGKPVLVPNMTTVYAQGAGRVGRAIPVALANRLGGEPGIVTPILGRAGVRGIMTMSAPRISEADTFSLQTLAHLVGAALDQIELVESLDNERAQLDGIFSSIDDTILVHSVSHDLVRSGFTQVNEAATALFGYSRDEFRDLVVTDLVAPGEGAPTASIAETLREGRGRFELMHRTKSGDLFPAEVRVRAIAHEEGWRVFSVVRDLRARRAAERSLEQLSAAMGQSPAMVLLLDAAGSIEYVNPQFEQTLGHMSPDIQGRAIDEVFAGIIDAAARDELRAGDTVRRQETTVHTAAGKARWVALAASAVRIDGAVEGYVATMHDITERRAAEEERRAALELLQSTIDGVGEPLMVIGLDNRVQLMNRVVRERYGAEVDEEHVTCHEISHGYDRPCHEHGEDCPLQAVQQRREPVRVIHEHREPDGTTRTVELLASPLLNSAGEMVGIVESTRDITERIRLEEELFQARNLESLGVLAGGIAHDFNNLLTVIEGNVGFAMDSGCEGEVGAALEDATRACAQAVSLTHQLLTFSRGGSPVRKATRLGDVVEQSLVFSTRGTSVRPELEIEDGLWDILADRGQLHQVLQNLAINAVQAMPAGGKLRVRSSNQVVGEQDVPNLEAGRYVCIEVSDEGHGISEADRRRIFDPYFTTKDTGSGLGLATTYSIVVGHGGHISVESVVGEGTTFRILLPASPGAASVAPKRRLSIVPVDRTYQRVLVMDDDVAIQRTLRRILAGAGYRVDVCSDGEEAIAAYRQARSQGDAYAAVVLDLTVPGGMGGELALRALREIDPEIRSIVSSGYTEGPVMAEYEKFGFDGVVKKPYRPDEFTRVLRDVLERDRPG